MFRSVRTAASLFLTPLLFSQITMRAQETLTNASVTGRVLDPSEALVSHASVNALAIATNQSYTAQTDAQGRFRLPYLPVGEYRITAQADGFSQVSREVQLTIGSAFDL